ncbi:hypothetical protein [Winogradskyella sp.]|uniref:hypothetical protein n=1 Tax=Winogradskyella sp. TaxID=1883156 RepID=UPI002619D710|nr:hypothetical protein [Winogradskyella sp.]
MRIFKEEQRFTQLWLIVLVVVSMMVPLGIILGSYIKNPNRFSGLELITIIGIITLASGIIFIFKLSSRIDELGIHYKFFPFHLKSRLIKWQDINTAYVRTYDAITEYGGWGLKGGALWKKSKGTAINVSGDIGIQLELKNGKKLLIGTQKENEAKKILETYKSKIDNQDE